MPKTAPMIRSSTRPQAGPAAALYDALQKAGFNPTRRCFPTFLAASRQDGHLIFVQAARHRSTRLRTGQKALLEHLASLGADCYLWEEEKGFSKIGLSAPA